MRRFVQSDFLAIGTACVLVAAGLVVAAFPDAGGRRVPAAHAVLSGVPVAPEFRALLSGAYAQVGVTTGYDPTYRKLAYPGGDVPLETGVCTDVVIRAYRAAGADLQALVHKDMAKRFSQYPKKYGMRGTDTNIDHRRVPNLMEFFRGQKASVPVTATGADYLPGDVVAWRLPGNLTHIGIVAEVTAPSGVPLVVHNIGRGAHREDILFAFPILGHYRWAPPTAAR